MNEEAKGGVIIRKESVRVPKADEESDNIHPVVGGADVLVVTNAGRMTYQSVEVEELAVQEKLVAGVGAYADRDREIEVEVAVTRTVTMSGPDTVEVTGDGVPRLTPMPSRDAQVRVIPFSAIDLRFLK